jgi:[protein-PII] uridylyltransferase
VANRLLEAARVPEQRKPRIRKLDASFLLWNGRLAAADPQVFRERPSEMVRLFRVALEQDVEIYSHTKELVEDVLSLGGAALAGDAESSRHFLGALCDLRDTRQPSLLEEMHQVGVLGAVMPEFAPCTCRVQHDLYHVYTVDQHQLYAVAMVKRTMRGELAAEAPLATEVARQVAPSPALFLGTLLHDVGKPLGKGHAEKGARLAGSIARRLGLPDPEVTRAEMLVRQHLTMAHLSQRRDLADPDVIARFGDRIGDAEALAQLYLLTRCDTAMTAPGNLSAWKDQLLGDLYVRTGEYLRGGAAALGGGGEQEQDAARSRIRALMPADSPEGMALIDRLDERMVAALTPRQVARHLVLAGRRAERGRAVDLEVTAYPLKGRTEVAVVADDSLGLLSHIAGVLAAHRVSIDTAVVSTVEPPGAAGAALALDLFYVRDLYGKVIAADDSRWELVRRDLAAILQASGEPSAAVLELLRRRRRGSTLRPRVTPEVPTVIQIVDDASHRCTVVEVATRDRIGVLHTITRTMAALGLDIHLAKVSTEGERVADAFYVTCREEGGSKLVDPRRVEELEVALGQALAQGELE